MRIQSGSVPLNNSTRITSKNRPVGDNKETTLEKTHRGARNLHKEKSRAALISREDLLSLASDLKDGRIDREEANTRFVGTVINNSIKETLSERDRERLISDISEFFSEDPDFLKSLEKHLSNLS